LLNCSVKEINPNTRSSKNIDSKLYYEFITQEQQGVAQDISTTYNLGTLVSFVFACVPANAEIKHKFQVTTVNFLTVQSPLVTLRTGKFNVKKFMF
jgi:hypothetical protein